MATKLYLLDTVSPLNPGTNDERQLGLSTPGASVVGYVTNTVAGPVTPPTTATQFTRVAAGTPIIWYSPSLQSVTISGTVTFNLWAKESQGTANATVTAELLRCDSSGNILSVIAAVVLNRAELSTTIAANNWTATPTSTTLNAGDTLAVRVYIDDGNGVTMASGKTVTVDIGGATTGADGDSYVQVTEALSLNTTPVSQTAQASYESRSSVSPTALAIYEMLKGLFPTSVDSYESRATLLTAFVSDYEALALVTSARDADSFERANGSLGSNWGALGGGTPQAIIVSNGAGF